LRYLLFAQQVPPSSRRLCTIVGVRRYNVACDRWKDIVARGVLNPSAGPSLRARGIRELQEACFVRSVVCSSPLS
jgi:hypothetical protein